jgi:hypothetical protein
MEITENQSINDWLIIVNGLILWKKYRTQWPIVPTNIKGVPLDFPEKTFLGFTYFYDLINQWRPTHQFAKKFHQAISNCATKMAQVWNNWSEFHKPRLHCASCLALVHAKRVTV